MKKTLLRAERCYIHLSLCLVKVKLRRKPRLHNLASEFAFYKLQMLQFALMKRRLCFSRSTYCVERFAPFSRVRSNNIPWISGN